jgi:hypothetical protein
VVVVHTCNPILWGEVQIEGMRSESNPGYSTRPYLQINEGKRTGAVAQVVEHLPGKGEVLSSNPRKKK